MLNSFPQHQNTDADAMMLACDIALEGLRDDAIQDACRRFMKGQVPSHDPRFAPSVAQLALEAQARHDHFERLDTARNTPAIEHKPAPVGNRVSQAKMQALSDHLAGKITADELAKITQRSA